MQIYLLFYSVLFSRHANVVDKLRIEIILAPSIKSFYDFVILIAQPPRIRITIVIDHVQKARD